MDLLEPLAGQQPDIPTVPTSTMFERLAADPNVPVEKLEKLIEMQERIMRFNAEMAFNSAFSDMSPELPTVAKNGKSLNGPYATLADIIEAVRPVLHKFGFAVSHKTTFPVPGKIVVTGILTHRQGHAITTSFEAAADTTGNKNAIQALGSSESYGRRYTTQSLLFLATKDDNGRASSAPAQPEVELEKPEGYDAWLAALSGVADEGKAALDRAWTGSRGVYKNYINKVERPTWDEIKRRAAQVKK